MYPDIAFRMKLRWLFHALHGLDLRQNFMQQARGVQQFKTALRAAFGQDAGNFISNALR